MADDQVLVCTEGLDLPDTFYVGSLPFHIAQRLGTGLPVNGSAIISSEYVSVLLVVANDAVVQEILAQSSEDIFSQEFLIQLNLDGTEDEKLSYAEYLLEKTGDGVSRSNSHQDNAIDLYTMYGGFLFLGIFLVCCSCWPQHSLSITNKSLRDMKIRGAIRFCGKWG